MKPELQIKQGESLSDWCDRIADYWHFRDELRETLHVISETSHLQGKNDALAVPGCDTTTNANKKK